MKIIFSSLIFICSMQMAHAEPSDNLYACNLELKSPAAGDFYARVYIEDLTADPASSLRFRWMTLTAPKTGSFVSLFPSITEFQYRIQSVELPQTSEAMGGSYRVGFCYVGPTAAVSAGSGQDDSQGRYDFVGTINTGILPEDVPYQGSVTGVCDLRSVGSNQNARGATELFPTSMDADTQWSINLGNLTSGEMSFDSSINSQIAEVPRFCKINVEVDEISTGSRPTLISIDQSQITLQIDKNLL
jgi:hypothetical protein